MFGRRYDLFTLLGFPIRLDLSWLVIFTLVAWTLAVGFFPRSYPGLAAGTYWAMGVASALGLFASILAHELAHAVVARRRGMHIRGVTLFIFGGVAELGGEPPNPGTEARVAVAGPIASVAIALAAWGLAAGAEGLGGPAAVVGVLGYLGLMNAVLVAFNLVPAFPLDGGRVLRAALWRWKDDLGRATRISSRVGSAFGTALCALGVIGALYGAFVAGIWWVLIGLFLRRAARGSYESYLVRWALEGVPVRRVMAPDPEAVAPSMTLQEVIDAYVYGQHRRRLPVVGDDGLEGYVTTRGIREVARDDWASRTVAEVIEPPSTRNTVGPGADAMRALERMTKSREPLFVADGPRLLGVLTPPDIMRYLSLKLELEGDEAIPHPSWGPVTGEGPRDDEAGPRVEASRSRATA